MAVPITTGPPHSPAATSEPAAQSAASDTTPGATPETTPNASSTAAPGTMPGAGPETAPDAASGTTPDAASEAASGTALDAASMATRIRQDVIRMAGGPEGAHAGGSLSCADVMAVLHAELLRPGDSFVLSKGHAAPALYSALSQLGRFPVDELDGYAQPGSRLFGHPRFDLPGVEFATGSLGHGIGLSVGLALAEQLRGGDRHVYTILGDGELQEGSVWEAALLAGHRRLPGLVATVDRNGLQITGGTEDCVALEPLDAKFEAFGWQARTVDGHDLPALRDALRPSADGPVAVIARTVKGRGVPFLEQRVAGHYAKLKPALVQRALAAIGRSAGGPS